MNVLEICQFLRSTPLTRPDQEALADAMKANYRLQDHMSMAQFRRGDRVEWGKGNSRYVGTVISLNERTISVREESSVAFYNGRQWKVAASLLTKVPV